MATTEQSAGTPSYNGLDWAARPASESDLARGMLLLRASNMNVMRLQLAMERSDRRLAMEELDCLVALDGEIKGFIEDMPPADAALHEMTRRIDAQKRSEEHTSELQSLMRTSYAVFCLKKKKTQTT